MRLVNAELLKLRKRRGLVLSGLGLAAVPMIIAYAVLLILHAANPEKHGPAGGVENLSGSIDLLMLLSIVAAVMVGATLGAGDVTAGVFRELVITGRSRLGLFAARIPAGLAVVWTLVAAGFAVTAVGSTVFAGSLEAPTAGLLVGTAAWLALVSGISLMLALGVSSLLGSRGTTIGIVIGWLIVVAPLLAQIKLLGALREALPLAPTERLAPAALFEDPPIVPMSIAAAVVAVIAWTAAPLMFGAWRTATRDA
jgi:hypothetical protein